MKSYYERNKKKIKKYQRDKNLLKRFGFIPKVNIHNKNITSNGCFLGNSKLVLKHLVNKDNQKKGYSQNDKAIWVYKVGEKKYKIQIGDILNREEFWINFEGTPNKLIKFFNKLKGFPINFIKNWDKEVIKNVKMSKL